MVPPQATAATEKIIFDQSPLLACDLDGLLSGAAGTLYAVSIDCGAFGQGGIVQLTAPPTGQGLWNAALLYSFRGRTGPHGESLNDGTYPSPQLLRDRAGALYGATTLGGRFDTGTIYRLTPPQSGASGWTETVLFDSFDQKVNGVSPSLSYRDSSGVLYGVTSFGGYGNSGTAFRLAPPATTSLPWKYSLPYSFDPYHGDMADGRDPTGLTLAADGSFYGTTSNNTSTNVGTVFQLVPPAGGRTTWSRNIVLTFPGDSVHDMKGEFPLTPPIADRSVTLYGTTSFGGPSISTFGVPGGRGVVYRLTPPASSKSAWSESILYSFAAPEVGAVAGGLVEDSNSFLYGTTVPSGADATCAQGCGTVFRLSPRDFGGHATPWDNTLLHRFTGVPDGNFPNSTLVPGKLPDGTSVLFGTTKYGGKSNGASNPYVDGYGTVFEIIP